jgi:hypothetical protein
MKACRMAARALLLVLSGALPGYADTNLFSDGTWIVDGATDPGPNPSEINVVTNALPAGAFSELKFYCNIDDTNLVQVFSIKGNGTFQPTLPPPGETGGAYTIGSYWDCDQGFIGSMAVTELALGGKPKGNGRLQVQGKLSNRNSMQSDDLTLVFQPVETNSVRVDVSYKLIATRDFCVDRANEDAEDEFRVVSMQANYLSPETNDNDLVRYQKVVEKVCIGFDCSVTKKHSYCVAITNGMGYVINNPRQLADRDVSFFHTQTTPRNTPTLQVSFRSPAKRSMKLQGFVSQTSDPSEPNVQLWGNWMGVRGHYNGGQKIGNFRYTLKAEAPRLPNCDRVQE